MADKKAGAAEAKSPKKGGGLLPLLAKVFGVLSILSISILLAGTYDVGSMDLKKTLMPLAIVFIGLYALLSIAALFMGGKSSPAADLDTDALMAKIEDVQKINTSRIVAVQNKIDGLLAQDYEAVLAENKELHAQLDEIKNAEREKADTEMEELRQRNDELEALMKQWAIETVGSAISPVNEEPETAVEDTEVAAA